MRKLAFLLFPILICCNSNPKLNNHTILEYQYPMDSLKIPKVFVYQRTDSGNIFAYQYYHLIHKDHNNFMVKCLLGNASMRDSNIYKIDKGAPVLTETYMIMRDLKSSRVKIAFGEIVKQKGGFYEHLSEIRYPHPFLESFIGKIINTSTYDTIVTYRFDSISLPCIRYREKMEVSIKHKFIPFVGKTLIKTGESVLAKGIGLVYYNIKDSKSGVTYSWKLSKIMDYKDFSFK